MAALRIVVVVACAVAAVDVGAWNVPRIPAGRRAQYYLQKDDGAYQYGYDTGAGHSGQAVADAANEVQGQYQYVGADGRAVGVRYSAGQGGYVPQVDGVEVPAVPAAGPASAAAAYGARYGAASGVVIGAGAGDAALDADYDANADASYSFNIDTDSYKRTEQADARGNVRGQYSYSSAKGGSHALSYVAGEGTGFVVTGGSPAAPGAPGAPALAAAPYSGSLSNSQGSSTADGSYSFGFDTSDQSRQESADALNNVRGSYSFTAADDGKSRRIDYEAGAATGFVARGDHLPVAPSVDSLGFPVVPSARYPVPAPAPVPATPYSGPVSNAQGSSGVDGSYTFSFDTNEQSRQESADAHNNVRGSYSFKAKDDGKVRRVDYVAGAATGFVASGNHLPVAPEVPAVPGDAISTYAAPVVPFAPAFSAVPAATVPISGASDQSSSNVDGSYSFSFSTNDQSRQESSDAKNNVRGSYSFKAKDDGLTRRVDYEAGSATGFVAKGAHLPVAPAVPAVPAVSVYSAPIIPAAPISPVSSYSGPVSNAQGSANPDGSYTFSFNTNDQSRQEAADSQNNVRGSYSFKAKDDGVTRRVDYVAGAATGFVAQGDHLPKAPPAPVALGGAAAVSRAGSAAAASRGAISANADGSYSFSYDAADHSRQEAADSAGNVRGSFSFVAKDDGQARRVDYSAGAATGFLASGAHLPVAGADAGVGGAPASGISTYSAVAASGANPTSGDASYAYSYQTDSSRKSESSDAQGNVRGEYSYTAGDGKTRKVSYTARKVEGFVASGDLAPSGAAGAAGGAAGAGPAGRASAHGALTVRDGGGVINQYLPPQSAHKFGYIYDTKA